jgi:hypothetical protein
MPNWSVSMQRTYEYYVVDPATWRDMRRITNVKSSSISRDLTKETLGSASLDTDESLGECYVRIYLITVQNGITEKHPLGTFLVQTPSLGFDGRSQIITIDTYTPLLELKETPPPIGYSIRKNENIMSMVYRLTKERVRAPVVETECDKTLFYDFVADANDTWLSYLSDLADSANYSYALDEMGRILFSPKQDTGSLRPVWTYNDDNSSILYPNFSMNRDLYDVPNVVEVVYSRGSDFHYARAVNDDPNSPTSTVSRGREIVRRITDPNIIGNPTETEVRDHADKLLRELSTLEYTISYSHGYCPVRIGDCVRLNYKRAGVTDVKAKVISQTIECNAECKVTETAVFTTKLWR